MINNEINFKLITITKQLINKPISSPFRKEVISGIDVNSDYFEIIKNPQDLTKILLKLQNKEYLNIYDYMYDIELVWYNAEKYHGNDSMISIFSKEMRYIFEKKRRKISNLSISSWIYEVNRLRTKLEILVQKSPNKIIKFIPDIYKLSIPNPIFIDLTQHEIQCLKIGIERLNNEENIKRINEIILEKQPNIINLSNSPNLNFFNLELNTIKSIQNYVKISLNSKGLKYLE